VEAPNSASGEDATSKKCCELVSATPIAEGSAEHPLLKISRTSCSLLSSATGAENSRKGRVPEAGLVAIPVNRASMSMPPPAGKASDSCIRRPVDRPVSMISNTEAVKGANDGASDVQEMVFAEDTENRISQSTPVIPLTRAIKGKSTITDSDGNRLSFSSLFTNGSSLFNGNTGNMSATSSNNGSLKSVAATPDFSKDSASTFSSTAAIRNGDITTAWPDPVAMSAISQSQQAGLSLMGPACKERI
jgi:hypothetical protein